MASEEVIFPLSQVFSPEVLLPSEKSLRKSLCMEMALEYKNIISLVASLI